MPIKGAIIKSLIEFGRTIASEPNPVESQQKVLKSLLDKAKNTAFGKFYRFEDLLESENMSDEFAKKLPFFDYNKITEEWWIQTQGGASDITWPGTPSYFALSSGTTGKTSKRIPVTDDMIDAIRLAGIKQVGALSNFDLPSEFFEKEIMMLGSSTNLHKNEDHLEGEISGISASNIPFWFQGYYKPGREIAKIDNWDKRVGKIVENAADWDIGALSGIPSWMELMLKKVIEYHHLNNIHEIWPNLQVYASGGVAFQPYKKSFMALMGKPITVIDTYLASEGFLAFQNRPETDSMQLITDNGIYFEFVPFDPEYINADGSLIQKAPSLSLEKVELGKEYVLVISTVSGAWRYLIGDTIEFTDVEKAEIRITGRTKFFLNVVGEQLSVNKMNDAVQELERELDTEIPEFTLSVIKKGEEFYHKWYLGMNDSTEKNETEAASILDEFLKSANKNYRVARSKALKGVIAKIVAADVFYDWSGFNKKKGGQVKMEKVMDAEKFAKWEKFVVGSLQ
ncbi:MAG TPA: GH3 auxin-responsive promoter family protein [Flavobacteriaceae bacterium]|nr:GH3 auxin-responsive promoter family protein [Flavobacteriaceae bacterium]